MVSANAVVDLSAIAFQEWDKSLIYGPNHRNSSRRAADAAARELWGATIPIARH